MPGKRPGRDPRPVTSAADGLRGVVAIALAGLLVVTIVVLSAVLLLWVVDVGGG